MITVHPLYLSIEMLDERLLKMLPPTEANNLVILTEEEWELLMKEIGA